MLETGLFRAFLINIYDTHHVVQFCAIYGSNALLYAGIVAMPSGIVAYIKKYNKTVSCHFMQLLFLLLRPL